MTLQCLRRVCRVCVGSHNLVVGGHSLVGCGAWCPSVLGKVDYPLAKALGGGLKGKGWAPHMVVSPWGRTPWVAVD